MALAWGSVGDMSSPSLSSPSSLSLRCWPLTSWAVYRFDPPEIALVYFNEGKSKGSTFLQHVSDCNVTAPFARINLGSLHREGGLRSEVLNVSVEPLPLFQLRFSNPNGTRYHMHNSFFTFTLNVTI